MERQKVPGSLHHVFVLQGRLLWKQRRFISPVERGGIRCLLGQLAMSPAAGVTTGKLRMPTQYVLALTPFVQFLQSRGLAQFSG